MSKTHSNFHNSTGLAADELAEARHRANKQNAQVLAIFRDFDRLTPSQAYNLGRARGFDWLLTSVRRSITNLTRQGELIKTELTRGGPYGRPETVWEFVA